MKLLGTVYRRLCLDFDDMRNLVERWRAGGRGPAALAPGLRDHGVQT
ncbi:MAG: hypothetical protein OXB98_15040 [Bryobacterales bacterium]|nr:hypothetical protein [Bryobacterales bacterium]